MNNKKAYNCIVCNKEVYRYNSEIVENGNVFCSQSCSCKHRNKITVRTEKSKQKTAKSLLSYHNKRGRKYKTDKLGNRIGYCKICNKKIKSKRNSPKICKNLNCIKECGRISAKSGWLNNKRTKTKRSKSECLLSDKLKIIFPDLTCNTFMFSGGFDADIVIPSLKLAIHWNGPWHYRPIISTEHFDKIRLRDIRRYKSIELDGYKNYIIKDETGIFNSKFVEIEYEKLINFIKLVLPGC